MASKYTNVAVHNRGNFPVTGIQFDGDEIVWGPRETKHLQLEAAKHCIRKSAVRWDPITQQTVHKLVELKAGQTEADIPELSYAEAHPDQLLDTSNMPPTSFDSEGRPLHGEIKTLANPVGMLTGRVPAGANLGLPRNLTGAAGAGLGAQGELPRDIAERLDEGTDRFVDQVERIVPQENRVVE